MIRKPRTLLWRMGLMLMAVQAAAVILLGWYAAYSFRTFSRQHTVLELERSLPILVNRYRELLETGVDVHDLQRRLTAESRETSLRVTLISSTGQVLADSDRHPETMDNHLYRPEVQTVLTGTGEPQSFTRVSTTTGELTTYMARVVQPLNGEPIVVRVALPLSAIESASANFMQLVGAAALISLILTFTLIYLVSSRLSGSVQRLADGAARFAAGDLNHRIDRPESRELATLARALNHMAARLSDQIDMLQAQRSEQQAIHQSMTNGLIALDPEERIISVNRAAERLLGINGAESRGRLLQEVLREPELHRLVSDSFASAEGVQGTQNGSNSGSKNIAELQLGRAGGPRIQVVSQPLRNVREQPAGLLLLMTDVTELRRLETIRTDFAANVSHELRTPITNIKGYVETMLEVGVHDESQTRRFLEVISRNTHRLASIIEDLLALARLEQPDTRAALERQTFAAQRLIDAAIAQLESEISARSTRLVVRVPKGLTTIANFQLLEQALANLIANAVKYSPKDTTVTVSAERSVDGEVTFAVADEGPGIPEEHLPRIFERFYRVDRARSREMGGTGLGLAIVKHIALVHRGRVTVESEVGRGSVFRLTIPEA